VNTKNTKKTLATPIFTIIFVFLSVLFIPSASAQSSFSQIKAEFENSVDDLQIKGLSPFEIAVRIRGEMIQLIQESANRGMTLKQIVAVAKNATKGAVAGCLSKPSGYKYTPVKRSNIEYQATCTHRPEKPLNDCAAIVLSMVEGAKIAAANIGMGVAHENRLINAIGEGSDGCVQAIVQKVKQLTPDEKDAIDEAAEESRQLTLNITSPKL
jgi:hypothetical protein